MASLEDKVNDKKSKGFIRKACKLGFNLAVAGATTALSTATVGTLGIAIGGALAAGGAIGGIIKKEPFYNIVNGFLKSYSAMNAVIYPMVLLGNATFPLIPNETLAGKIIRSMYAVTAYNAAFVGSYGAAEHLIDNNLNPTGITKAVSNNFSNRWRRLSTGFAPSLISVANDIPYWFGMPAFAVNAPFVSLYNKLYPIPTAKKSENPGYLPRLATAPQYA